MCDSRGGGMPPGRRSRLRTFSIGVALAAAASFTGAFGFTSAALLIDNGLVAAGDQADSSTCLCGSGGPCCGFCGPDQKQARKP